MNKKWILLAALVMGVLLLMRFVDMRRTPHRPAPQPRTQKEAGVPMPADIPAANVRTAAEAPAGPGICADVPEIVAAHGKTWGEPRPRGGGLSSEQSAVIYDLLERYYACKAALSGEPEDCGAISGKAFGAGFVRGNAPGDRCRERAAVIAMLASMSGLRKDDGGCRMASQVLKEDGAFPKNVRALFSAKAVCSAASHGLEGFCESLLQDESKAAMPRCLLRFPADDPDCKGDQGCYDTLRIYRALQAKDPRGCPREDEALCSAAAARDPYACEQYASDLSMFYCGFRQGGAGAKAAERKISSEMRRRRKELEHRKMVEEEKAQYERKWRGLQESFKKAGERNKRKE